jgi:hypothetical protein
MFAMNRREFIKASAASVALGASGLMAADTDGNTKRVGLIGCGWYGKSDLLRLIQVAPVEVVSLCDVDRNMVSAAAELVASRQASKKKARVYHDYREMLREKDLDIVLIGTPDHWHASMFMCKSQSASILSKARRCWPPPANTSASSRSAHSAGARLI